MSPPSPRTTAQFQLTLPTLLLLSACSGGSGKDTVTSPAAIDGGDKKPAFELTHLSCGDLPARPGDYRERPAPDACRAAMEASCCSEAEACAADPDCLARVNCYSKCGNDFAVCGAQCDVTNPTNPLADAWGNCESVPRSECMDLSCIGQEPPKPSDTSTRVTYRLSIFGSSAPMDGVRLHVCALDDLDCATPLYEALTDADGSAELGFPPGQVGQDAYVEARGAAIAPTLLFLHSFGVPPQSASYGLLDSATLGALRGVLGAPDDPARGLAAINPGSCGKSNPPGLKFASSAADSTTVQQYDVNNFPSPSATATDGHGVGGHLGNHPAGKTTITVTDGTTGARYGTMDIIIRAGYFTVARVVPSP